MLLGDQLLEIFYMDQSLSYATEWYVPVQDLVEIYKYVQEQELEYILLPMII